MSYMTTSCLITFRLRLSYTHPCTSASKLKHLCRSGIGSRDCMPALDIAETVVDGSILSVSSECCRALVAALPAPRERYVTMERRSIINVRLEHFLLQVLSSILFFGYECSYSHRSSTQAYSSKSLCRPCCVHRLYSQAAAVRCRISTR